MSVIEGLHPVNLSDLGLKPLSASELKDLHPLTIKELARQLREGDPASPSLHGIPPRGGNARDVNRQIPRTQNSSPQDETGNFLGSENPGRRRKSKSEIFSGTEIPPGRNALPPDPPEWVFAQTDNGPRFAPLPTRVLHDRRIRGVTLLCLAGLAAHASKAGICYPGQHRLAALLKLRQPQVSIAVSKLIACGYLVKLVPVGKKRPGAFKRGNSTSLRLLPCIAYWQHGLSRRPRFQF